YGTNKQSPSDNADIDKLADELLVHILSRMSLKEAARTCILARRWRYLWRSVSGTLQFDVRDFVTAAGDGMEVEKFVSWVNTVLELHQGRYIEGIVVIFCFGMNEKQLETIHTARIARVVDSWVYVAVKKELERFELHLPWATHHKFPSIEMLKSHSHGGSNSSPFCRLKILRLLEVPIEDEVVHYFLASCPNLEQLFIYHSDDTKNIRVVDPPSLRVLEIKSWYLESLEISAESLVSLAHVAPRICDLKKVPNLDELTIGDDSFLYFISEPNSSYSGQLVKLVVDLQRLVCVATQL
ncbi:F-box/FBD/LRR-repeat protein At3g26920-like, partial [Salvia miltiorrhiza]|uniref:F-box/FBD/LRR-repeat protein At3g26920-like n=1 Tax=Salvia miltiorrhiza TaxID=226208 RepID=UPI0025AD78EA